MKIYYDKKADAVYIELSKKKANGVIEIKEGVNIDVNKADEILGIEILDASKKLSLKSFSSYKVSPELLKSL